MGNVSVRQSKSRKKAVAAGFRSKLEQRCAQMMSENNMPYEYEPKDKVLTYTLPVRSAKCANCGEKHNIVQQHSYTTDFYVRGCYVEVKGRFIAKDRKKMLAIKEQHPDKKFVIALQSPKVKITKKTNYAQWCEKKGFIWVKAPSGIIKYFKK